MMRIEKAAVLGAGTMGAQIAAHLANAGVPTLLLDIPPRELTPDEQKKGLTLESPQVRGRIARDANVVDVFDRYSGFRQTIAQRRRWKSGAMLHAIKALFFGRRHDAPVFDQCRRSVTVICVDT